MMAAQLGFNGVEIQRPEPGKLVISRSRIAHLAFVLLVLGLLVFWYYNLFVRFPVTQLLIWLFFLAPALMFPRFIESLVIAIAGDVFVFDGLAKAVYRNGALIAQFSDVAAVCVREPWLQSRPFYSKGAFAVGWGRGRSQYGLTLILRPSGRVLVDRACASRRAAQPAAQTSAPVPGGQFTSNFEQLSGVAKELAAFVGADFATDRMSFGETLLNR